MASKNQEMSLLSESIQQLEQVGYCCLRSVYNKSRMQKALDKIAAYYAEYRDTTTPNVPFLNIGQPTLYNLQNKDLFFLELLFEPKILQDILIHFLNDRWFRQIPQHEPNYTLRSLIARSSYAALPMHIDSFVPYQGSHLLVMQYSIILEDQRANNGCTIVVPRSHLSGEYTTQEAAKDAIPLESKVGDVVVWDSRVWHGTTANTESETRWAIVATFCRWWLKQQWNLPRRLPQEFYEKLADSQKAVLGFCSIPYNDENEGIDLKRGYDSLSSSVNSYRTP